MKIITVIFMVLVLIGCHPRPAVIVRKSDPFPSYWRDSRSEQTIRKNHRHLKALCEDKDSAFWLLSTKDQNQVAKLVFKYMHNIIKIQSIKLISDYGEPRQIEMLLYDNERGGAIIFEFVKDHKKNWVISAGTLLHMS